MKQFSLIFILSFFLQNTFGQVLTKEEAYAFADKLLEVEILSERGRNMLKMQIDEKKLERDKRPNLITQSTFTTTELLPSNILFFCANVAGNDFYYRSGMFEREELLLEMKSKNPEIILNPKTEEDFEKLQETIEKEMKDFEGYKIEEKIIASDSLPIDFGYSIYPFSIPTLGSETELIHKKRSVLGRTRIRTLDDLLKSGLISEVVYNEVFPKIKSNELYLETLVFLAAAERTAFYEEYDEAKSIEIEFLNGLKNAKIVSEGNYQKAIESYEAFELKGKYGMLPFCNNTKVFKLKDFPKDPEVSYEKIYEEIKAIVPDFDFKNFSCEIIEGEIWDENVIELKVLIKFEVNDVEYSNSFFYDYKTISQDSFHFMRMEKDSILKIGEQIIGDFVNGINQFLTDQSSKQRLYFARRNSNDGELLKPEIGVILMTEQEYKVWHTGSGAYFMSAPSHENIFMSKKIKSFINDYQRIGLFDNLSKEEIEAGENCVAERNIKSYHSILHCFPNILFQSGDGETAYDSPYKRLVLTFSKYSKGQFLPTEIIDEFDENWNKKTTKFSFIFNGKKYEKDLKVNSDWEDYAATELIFQAIKESEIDGAFYYVDDYREFSGFIFLTKKQHEFLLKKQSDLFLTYDEYLKKND